MQRSTLGNFRAYWLGTVVLGGVLTPQSFTSSFRCDTAQKTRVNSLAVGLQQLGASLGARAVIQTIDNHTMGTFHAGRIIAGEGLGSATVVHLRGQIASLFQLKYTIAPPTKGQCNGRILSACNSAALLGLDMLTLKESTRWLTRKGRHEKSWETLKWVRASDSEEVAAEIDKNRIGVEIEAQLLEWLNFKRIFTAFAVFAAWQATGATAFAYFGQQYFELLLGPGDKYLLLAAISGAFEIVASETSIFFFSERVGRRQVLIWGAVFMAACQTSCAAVVKNTPAPSNGNTTPSDIATVALIHLFVIAYNFGRGPFPWPYISEIFPSRIRELGVAVGVSSQWLLNFIFLLVAPYMIEDMGWGTFLI
ncbi:MFS general substrate transporter [Karstenula rhodostoma CBS 690.94]|uniref:MFS general substrate transporter n=1 Tax=Karstenula rhodostoma CBS 690.94 TaxID=1392251 RepID=A0A9P4PFQ1_9PLEO|nr:MFS general substrate transporter [Karstenula rhodostoma CBS 690.94]